MFVEPMDCFLTYNFSCINATFTQSNSSLVIFGDVLNPSISNRGDASIDRAPFSTHHTKSSSMLISIHHCIFTVLILGTIILLTIIGNIFVIAAVKLEKNLHSVAYYLFVSLAMADLMVACMVSDSISRIMSIFRMMKL